MIWLLLQQTLHDMTPGTMLILLALILDFLITAAITLIWFLLWIASKIGHFSMHYAPFGWTTLGIVALLSLCFAYGYYVGRWRVRVTNVAYNHSTVPESFNGYKIVHISDLHLSTFNDRPEQLERFVRMINDQNPDLICFTGDIVNGNPAEIEPYVGVLRQLKATNGVVSVLGNHDFLIYAPFPNEEARNAQVERIASTERELLGWNLLRNSHMMITRGADSIAVIGVDNQNSSSQGFHTISRGDLTAAMEGTQGFRILLSHDPSHWTDEVLPGTDIPLTLSGHTHAAQVRILGWTPAKLTFKQTYGLYEQDGQSLYVNIGLGCTAPFRIGANPEITLITLHTPHSR